MHVLVTGGAGFVGSNLIPLLEASGHRVRVFDNERLGRRQDLAGFQGEFVHGDVRDAAAVDFALEGVDAVIHLAADTRVIESIADPAFNFDVNVKGAFTLLQAMRRRGVRRIVNASTGGAILGEVEPPVHERMPARPTSPYGASKLAVEGYCSAFAGSFGLETLSLRFSNVYGPGSLHKGSVVATFMKAILAGETLTVHGDGSQTRDYVFVEDLCRGIMAGLEGSATGVLQLGSGVPLSVDDLIEAMRPVVRPRPVAVRYLPFRDGELRHTWCDIGEARAQLGYRPATELADGLERTWAWFVHRAAVRTAA